MRFPAPAVKEEEEEEEEVEEEAFSSLIFNIPVANLDKHRRFHKRVVF